MSGTNYLSAVLFPTRSFSPLGISREIMERGFFYVIIAHSRAEGVMANARFTQLAFGL